MAKDTSPVFQIKITLRDSQPAIWRRVLVSSETKLSQLHDVIQKVMGWKDSHLHKFTIGIVTFSARYEPGNLEELVAIDERYVKLLQLVALFRPFMRDFHFACEYEYDFGDGWRHEITFEGMQPIKPEVRYPFCMGGARACPPEDTGGPWSYPDFLAAITNPKHENHQDILEWLGEEFDSERFDLAVATKQMHEGVASHW